MWNFSSDVWGLHVVYAKEKHLHGGKLMLDINTRRPSIPWVGFI